MIGSKSMKKLEKLKKKITLKRRKSLLNFKHFSNSIVKSLKNMKSNYKLSLNKNFSFRDENMGELQVCNLRKAFRYEEKLKYKLNKCYDYDNPIVKEYLIKRLKSEFTITHVSQVIAPKQIDGNCWFNALFMMFFVSDKGRIFFRYMRQLMIEGETIATKIPDPRLKNAFALLNFIVECCLSGNKLAKSLNTNKIIKKIHELTKEKGIHVPNIGEAGNPIRYYRSLINYLGNNELHLVTLGSSWKNELNQYLENPPHIIIIESRARSMGVTDKLPNQFSLGKFSYGLDSASVINNDVEHFCSLVTCNGLEFAFDGYSKSRMIPFQWKKLINENADWNFNDYIYEFESKTKWNFTFGYSCLCYYRIS